MENQELVTQLEVKVEYVSGSLQFSNYETIKQNVLSNLKKYEGLILTDTNKQDIKDVKSSLNTLSKTLNNDRIALKKEYVKPLELFETQVKEIDTLIKNVVDKLDTQVKQAENEVKEQKRMLLLNFFNEQIKVSPKLAFITFEDVNLNITLTASEKSLKEQITTYLKGIENDLLEIETDEHKTRLLSKYTLSKNLQQSRISLNQELQKEKEFANVVEQVVNKPLPKVAEAIIEEAMTLTFKVTSTKSKLIKLREYMKEEGIIYE